jgi:hypothetical protein
MGGRRILRTALFIFACAPVCLAQTGEEKPIPVSHGSSKEVEDSRRKKELTWEEFRARRARQGGPSPLELPKGEGAWVVQVVSGGGVMGVGRGNFTVTSDGRAACQPARETCPASLAAEALRPLSEAVAAAATQSWQGRAEDVCHDCYFTVMMLQRREPSGAARTYLFTWDDLAAAKLPADVRRVYETALALTSGKP